MKDGGHRPEILVACGLSPHGVADRFMRKPGIPYLTAALVVSGRIRFSVGDGAAFIVEAPALVAIDPGTTYTASATGVPWSDAWLIARDLPQWRGRHAQWPALAPGFRALAIPADGVGAAISTEIREAMMAMIAAHAGAHPERQALAINAWERALLLAQALAPSAGRLHPAVAAAIAHANERPQQRQSVASLARAIGLSASHLAALTRASLGVSLMRHLRERRLERGRELLVATDWPIARIAAAAGFGDPFHFSNRFRARYGRSPRAYRHHLK